MKWDISAHPENQSRIDWRTNHTWIVPGRLSAMFIKNDRMVQDLHHFSDVNDGGERAISYRWYLIITDVDDSAYADRRSVQATFYAEDGTVLDGSTFGEISVWEVSPPQRDQIALVIDFTKVRSQNHRFGLHVLISHEVQPSMAQSGN